MTANKNEPDKKPAGSASTPAGSRPHATIDLKATEVKSAEAAAAAAKGKTEGAAMSKDVPKDTPKDTPTGKTAPLGAASAEGAPAAGASAAAGSPADGKSDKPATANANGNPPKGGTAAPTPAARPAPRGYGGFFTHVAAGLAGGVIALLGADMLAGQLGFETADQPDNAAALEQRLTALESARNQRGPNSDLGTRLAAAETKLGQLEQLNANIDGVSKKQADLAKEINTLGSKLSAPADTGADARVGKLEEQLSLMASAAEHDPQPGRLPQLAAISGKLADLESTMSNQLDALRKNVAQEIDTRLAAATEAGQAARSGTQRIDRELSTLKAESAEMAAGLTALKTDSDRAAAALNTTQQDVKRLKSDIDTRLAAFAKPEDVSSAVSPLNDKLSALQSDVQGVIKSEGDRRTTAERIVLSLELANLKRTIDRGKPYGAELAQTRKIAGNVVDLAPLERFALDGVPTTAELQEQFRPVAFKIIDADQQPADGSIVDRLLAGAKSVVRVRRTEHSPDDKSVEAVVSRMEAALSEDRLGDVLQQAKTLPAPAQEAAQDFLAKVEARDAVDRALASVETQLKASLAAAPAAPNGNAAQ